jgi:nitrite reductase (NADH) small subunit
MSVVERTTAHAVCGLGQLDRERGAAALVAGRQVALFRLPDDQVIAIDHRDPATGANVLARGLLGTTVDGEWYVASPLLKHRYSLADGRCLGDASLAVAVHGVDVRDGVVHVILASSS